MTDENSKPLDGRVALVTGASRGIGRAIALQLAQEGAHVIAMARTQGALEELDDAIRAFDGSASLVPADITDMEGLDRLGGVVAERWGKLDILVGNAGLLGSISPSPHIDPELFEETVKVNFTANWRLIRSFDRLLRTSDAGRAVFITSGASQSRKAYWSLYAATKAALDALVESYAKEVEYSNLKVNLVDPGPTATQMRAKAMPGEDPATLPKAEDIAELVVSLCRPDSQAHMQRINYPDWAAKNT